MIEFELDGRALQVPEGTTIIEAADGAGVYIPRFCYHKKLSIAANCRMCLVEVEKSSKPLPACATPITPQMKVKTKSDMACKAQRDVMEFLLINHPLDCPICDQGGECELQDLSMGYGCSHSEYTQPKRAVYSQDIGPLVETEMTRCIQCTRCVRFGEEIAGLRELGVVNRGEKEEIGTYVKHFLQSEISGNVIDICPVGALTNKPARYATRGWEVKEHASIAPHDCVGTNMYVHTRGHEYSKERTVFRAVPRENEAINEVWMSDRDRFCVEGLYHEDRVCKPMMKKNGEWVEVAWQYALDAVAHLTTHIQKDTGVDQIAGIAGYCSTTEEYYLFQKFIRGLGSPHVDHRIRECDFRDQAHRPLFPTLNRSIADIESLDALLLVGSNVRYEQPMISTRIYKAAQDHLSVMSVSAEAYPFLFSVAEHMVDVDVILSLSHIAKALLNLNPAEPAQPVHCSVNFDNITPSQSAINIAKTLKSSHAAIFVGAYAHHHSHAAVIRHLVHWIAQLSGATAGLLTDGANNAGAWIAGYIPHRGPAGAAIKTVGKDAKALLTTDPAAAYFLLNIEPELDSAYFEQSLEALVQAKLVVCMTTFANASMREYADFILPITPFTENDGTYVNVEGIWQSFTAASIPHKESKPAWKVLRVLANALQLPGFDYASINAVCDELKAQVNQDQCCDDCKTIPDFTIPPIETRIKCVPVWHMYQDNALLRRAKALQEWVKTC